jgi:hypothetical protein
MVDPLERRGRRETPMGRRRPTSSLTFGSSLRASSSTGTTAARLLDEDERQVLRAMLGAGDDEDLVGVEEPEGVVDREERVAVAHQPFRLDAL